VARTELSDGELDAELLHWFPSGDEQLQLFEVTMDADVTVAPHAHTHAEILLVTRGELRLGAQLAGPGTAVYIDPETLYAFRTGPEGCTFLNFRGVPRAGYLSRADLATRRTGTSDSNDR
jgi:hypothetical protein